MNRLIDAALAFRLPIIFIAIAVLIGGSYIYRILPVDAYPDISPSLVQVFVETDGLAPEEVEKYITYPIESSMNGLPNLDHVRSISNFGLSVINIYFEDGTDIYFARQLVGERLQTAKSDIPSGFGEPVMGPITTGLGQILFYILEDTSGRYSLEQLREVQDWIVKYNLQTVKGVTEILSIGGQVKQFQVNIDPNALLQYDITLPQVKSIIENNNGNTGAQFLVKNDEEYIVRSVGLATGLDDLKNIVVKTINGSPVYLESLGEIKIGGEIRRGLTIANGKGEAVVGMVLKLMGSNTSEVINATKARLKEINNNLPEGMQVTPYYDQASLVSAAINTVINALLMGIVLVIGILWLFMGRIRPSVIVALSIPFSVCFTFIAMYYLGISANLMSLGGLAIAIGMMVDGAVVITEHIDQELKNSQHGLPIQTLIARACKAMARPIAFAISIIIIVFIPLFTLQGVEGTTFRPLAYTVSIAMLGSLLYALLLAPAIAQLFMKPSNTDKLSLSDRLMFGIDKIYAPLIQRFVHHRKLTACFALALLAAGIAITPRLGSEFVPRLNEGDLLIRATMAPSISLEKAKSTMNVFEQDLLAQFPEVEKVVTRIGRGEVGAHADPVNSAEIFVALKPKSEWQTADNLEDLYSAFSHAFEDFPGAQFNFTQPIAAAVDELLTGTKAELAIKLFGEDLEILNQKAQEIEAIIRQVDGAQDVQKDQISGTPQVKITLDQSAIARYGLNVQTIQDTISIAVGGTHAGQIFQGVRRFDINLRLQEQSRHDIADIQQLIIENPQGQLIPLAQLAKIEEVIGPRQITRENSQRFITIQANVRGRDMGSFVEEANQRIQESITLPPGYFVNWGGQFELQQKANQRLMIVIPITLLLVLILLYANFNSFSNAMLIMLNIPLALVGGIIALWVSGQSLSVPASVGFIALFGIALENGLVLVSHLNHLIKTNHTINHASIQAARDRLRPVLMTALTTSLGLLPLLFATGTGSEVQKPLATVVVGGLISSTLVTLFILPAAYRWFVKVKI
ncbi:efflux RND transporter permease subunit [Bermanella marisrubri]|uniref:Heavy metal efflux pump, CzcA family protein n=1 Tax=Bermanella marisrubri TaxID=207949 RepID=Q1N4J1_9GAMM|nr:CusA/CzcA family heavy metal efflux RND transporter [Bermanella marisrubri]EAT13437.1 heavy metal efflux pump, CzcA family protein [Oceanobacter sp. RED65] [Bermanella marisrubri]QIZ84184.1 efflux RND transporter permease subunit [Bermanella marisrubri]